MKIKLIILLIIIVSTNLFSKEINDGEKIILVSFCIGTGYSAIINYKDEKYKMEMSQF
jgi:hypothetical protein